MTASADGATIIYTKTDEAPALATYSFLPIVEAFTASSGVAVETRDISLAGRVLANFPDSLTPEQQVDDALSELGDLAKTPEANIIKLPNISASVPQLQATVTELQGKGYALPDYPEDPSTEAEHAARTVYNGIMGSAVNPVLREGNSDRRCPPAVKAYARANPHRMGKWSADSESHVSTMSAGDFRNSEISTTVDAATEVTIQHVATDGTVTEMKAAFPLEAGEVFYKDVFAKHGALFEQLGVNVNNGHASEAEVLADIDAVYANGPALAMVDSDNGITNLHAGNDVIIDASMPAMIRTSGQMWNTNDETQDTKAVIPDSSYAGVYAAMIDFCKENGAFDPTTMGTSPN
eukprot:gene6377-13718_t